MTFPTGTYLVRAARWPPPVRPPPSRASARAGRHVPSSIRAATERPGSVKRNAIAGPSGPFAPAATSPKSGRQVGGACWQPIDRSVTRGGARHARPAHGSARSRHQQLSAAGGRARRATGFASSTVSRGSCASARVSPQPVGSTRRPCSGRSRPSRCAAGSWIATVSPGPAVSPRRPAAGPPTVRISCDWRRAAGIDLEVLGHEEEARLAMLGCLPLIDPQADQLLMLDIGGGSTEIMWVDRREQRLGEEPGHTLSCRSVWSPLSETFGGRRPGHLRRAWWLTRRAACRRRPLPASARSAGNPSCRCWAPRARSPRWRRSISACVAMIGGRWTASLCLFR